MRLGALPSLLIVFLTVSCLASAYISPVPPPLGGTITTYTATVTITNTQYHYTSTTTVTGEATSMVIVPGGTATFTESVFVTVYVPLTTKVLTSVTTDTKTVTSTHLSVIMKYSTVTSTVTDTAPAATITTYETTHIRSTTTVTG